jgi:hypothetical protein
LKTHYYSKMAKSTPIFIVDWAHSRFIVDWAHPY